MANYTKATNFTAKDGLPTGNSGKIVKGAEIDTEFTAIASAISSKADINSPALTGTPTAPTAAATIGTALHAFAEKLDLGQELGPIPDEWAGDLRAYEEATKQLNNLFIEQFCVLDKYKIAGTPDRIVEYKGERFIAEVKQSTTSLAKLKAPIYYGSTNKGVFNIGRILEN